MSQYARGIWKKALPDLGDALIVLGIIALSVPLIWSLRSTYLQEREESRWKQPLVQIIPRGQKQPVPVQRRIWPPTKLVIDKIDLSAVVVEGQSDKDLERGPMHLSGTACPGESGNCCIAAHKEKWFKRLRKLETGDSVTLQTHQRSYTYKITDQKTVSPKDISVLSQSSTPKITLITCTGMPYGGSKHRLVVFGVLEKTGDRKRS
jgi:sortase A